MTLDLSNVPDMEARKTAERLFRAMRAAEDAVAAAEEDTSAELDAKYAELRAAAYAEYTAKVRAIDEQEAAEGGLAGLKGALQAARDAYNDDAVPALETDYDDEEIIRCALSGIPLLTDDDVLTNDDGERVLRCLVLPPRAENKAEAA
jgi:hypothetical protein